MEMKEGLLLLDKEVGFTSHDAVQKARRLLKQKRIGHCGTLDPDATGLLLLTLGQATRLTRFLIRAPKVYEGVVRLGVATDTYDASGQVTAEAPAGAVDALTRARIEAAMARFVGQIEQKPPPYSAKKVGGIKYYELARRGEDVPDETKEVEVYDFGLAGEPAGGELRFRLSCSSGTYARGLAHDLGAALGVGAHLSALRRTRIGNFRVEDAVTLGRLGEALAGDAPGDSDGAAPGRALPEGAWVPFDRIPLPMSEVETDSQQEQRICHGQTVLVRELAGEEGDWVKLTNRRQEFIAIGTVIERIGTGGVGVVQPRVVFR